MTDQTPQTGTPDPLGLEIAGALQNTVHPATVILYGSRAAGEHRPGSDADILIVAQDHQGTGTAAVAAQSWLNTAKPGADVSIRTMTQEEFDRRRTLGQSIAGQASRHGVNAMGERLEYSPHHDPHEEEIWQETRGWLERSEEHIQDYNEREDANHWNLKALGHEARQAVEHAMKGLLTAHDDPSRFRHDLSSMWNHIDQNLPWASGQDAHNGKLAVGELMDHVTFQENPSGPTLNRLTTFAEGYRYEIVPREGTREERKDLQYLVNRAVKALLDESLRQRGAAPSDLFPNGRPWER